MEELGACVRAGPSASSSESLRALRLAKDRGVSARAPLLVVAVCEQLIKSNVLSEEENLAVCDQLVEALLHVPSRANLTRAHEILQALEDRFPASQRVGRLRALFEESRNAHEDAAEVMEGVIQVNEGNMIASRRIVAIRSSGGYKDAIMALNEHLATFGGDATAWARLGEIHMRGGRFVLASFCFSECVLLMPSSPHTHSRAGECMLAAAEAELSASPGKHAHKAAAKEASATTKRSKKDKKKHASRLAAVAASSAGSAASAAAAESLTALSVSDPLTLQARRHLSHAARLSGGGHIRTLLLLLEACAAVAASEDALAAASAASAGAADLPTPAGLAMVVSAGDAASIQAAAKENLLLAQWAEKQVLAATAGATTADGVKAAAAALVEACTKATLVDTDEEADVAS